MSQKIFLDNDWKFTGNYTEELLNAEFDDSALETVRLPHTCVETPFHYFDESSYQMLMGYRRKLFIPEEWRDKNIRLTIDGAAHEAEVFLNGKSIRKHSCGYTAFTVNLKKYANYGEENILVVKLDSRENLNIPPFGYVIDYMTYGGIYRDVYLEVEEDCYIKDVFAKGNQRPDQNGDITLCSEIRLNQEVENGYIRQSIKKWSADGKELGTETVIGESGVHTKEISLSYKVEKPELWSIEHPNLYVLKTELLRDGKVISTKMVRFGFRRCEFRKEGFYLNGKKVKLFGANRHQCFPYIGYAAPASMQQNDAEIIKNELGLNAVRTSHYPQSHYFIDRCDELGILVFTEIPGWQHIGDTEWKKQAVINVKEMVMQYRNHPSIMIWGVRINESGDDDAFYKKTNEVAHTLDDTRATGGVRCFKKSHLYEDVYTYNDFLHDGVQPGAEKKKDVTPDMEKAYLVSEYNGHMFSTKSFDCEEHRMEHALRHANVLDAVNAQDDIAGSFAWCMFDYNTHQDFGSGDRICYHGIMDMFRNPKMAAAVYASQSDRENVLEISSSMDIGEHPGCNRGKLYAFTNADSVRMYKNDVFIAEFGRDKTEHKAMKRGPILIDDFIGDQIVKNEPFTAKQAELVKQMINDAAMYGVGGIPMSTKMLAARLIMFYHMKFDDAVQLYNKYIGDWGGEVTVYRFEAVRNGKVVKTVVKEPMKKMHLSVNVNKRQLREDQTYDMAALRMMAVDENENLLPYCQEIIEIKTEGPIQIVGPNVISLRGGMGGTYLKTCGQSGEAKVILKAQNMQEVVIQLTVEA